MTIRPGSLLFAATAAVLAACGSGSPGGDVVVPAVSEPSATADQSLVDESYTGRYTATATVLQGPGREPELCAGGVAESLPPQCSGPPIAGWDWAAVEHETASGTTWGEYTVVGTWDGTTLTLTEPASAPVPPAAGQGGWEVDFTAPCPEPSDGWAPVDPAKVTQADFEAATTLAQGLDGHGGLWIDQNNGDAAPSEGDNDPARLVLVVTTTGVTSATEAAIREVWGGALCVASTERTEAELVEIQSAVMAEIPGVLGSGVSVVDAHVEVGVLIATTQMQQQIDEQFGLGAVLLSGALTPVD